MLQQQPAAACRPGRSSALKCCAGCRCAARGALQQRRQPAQQVQLRTDRVCWLQARCLGSASAVAAAAACRAGRSGGTTCPAGSCAGLLPGTPACTSCMSRGRSRAASRACTSTGELSCGIEGYAPMSACGLCTSWGQGLPAMPACSRVGPRVQSGNGSQEQGSRPMPACGRCSWRGRSGAFRHNCTSTGEPLCPGD